MIRKLFLSLAWALPTAAQTAEDPNIIVIYTGDQRYGDASCLNPEAKVETPNLDRLANEGIAFTNGHSPDTVCTPSRYALLTGRYCWRATKKTGVMGAEGECIVINGRTTPGAAQANDTGYWTDLTWTKPADYDTRHAR